MTIPGSDAATGGPGSPPPADDPTIVRAPGAIWRDGDFGVVVLGTAGHEPVTLAGTGVAVWDALDAPIGRRALVELLARRFAADPVRVARDVEPVLDGLLAEGVLEATA